MNKLIVLLLASVASLAAHAGDLPNPKLTPGAYNPNVTQANIQSTICVSGWTKTVRPPTWYTDQLKIQQIAQYGYSDTNTSDYEEDHLVALELGGAPQDPHNLWPEPHSTASGWTSAKKDHLENVLKTMVCNGQVTLAQARKDIASNWINAYKKYIGAN